MDQHQYSVLLLALDEMVKNSTLVPAASNTDSVSIPSLLKIRESSLISAIFKSL